jgi:hypothetical protein
MGQVNGLRRHASHLRRQAIGLLSDSRRLSERSERITREAKDLVERSKSAKASAASRETVLTHVWGAVVYLAFLGLIVWITSTLEF